jgi:hypothetical protein
VPQGAVVSPLLALISGKKNVSRKTENSSKFPQTTQSVSICDGF